MFSRACSRILKVVVPVYLESLRDRVCNYMSPLIDHCKFTLKDYFYLRRRRRRRDRARTWMTGKLYYPINVKFYSTFPSRVRLCQDTKFLKRYIHSVYDVSCPPNEMAREEKRETEKERCSTEGETRVTKPRLVRAR